MRRRGLAILSMLLLALTLIVGCSGGAETSGSRAAAATPAALELLETTGAAEDAEELTAADTIGEAEDTEDTETAPAEDETEAIAETPTEAAAEIAETEPAAETEAPETEAALDEDGEYNSKEDVALYIHLYGHLPSNYITKKEAESLGWSGGSLERYAPGKSIGGSRFGNYEGLLPDKKGRKYTECDIDTKGRKSRGAKRIVFSNDGLIYYTGDHYESFELLYGEE